MLDKSRGLNVDTIAYDLEDSVTPNKKVEARKNLRHLLQQPRAAGIREQAVRINSVESGLALADLQEVVHIVSNFSILYIKHIYSLSDTYISHYPR
jgi:citrate lyase subunit beta-like protein